MILREGGGQGYNLSKRGQVRATFFGKMTLRLVGASIVGVRFSCRASPQLRTLVRSFMLSAVVLWEGPPVKAEPSITYVQHCRRAMNKIVA